MLIFKISVDDKNLSRKELLSLSPLCADAEALAQALGDLGVYSVLNDFTGLANAALID